MNLLLDTHTVIWIFAGDPGLSVAAMAAVADPDNQVFVSAASAWEIAIKRGLGKLRAPRNYVEALRRYRFTQLDISTVHALAVEELPQHHNDPFDRLLIAQARLEKLTLVTRDKRMDAYDVRILEA